MKGSDKPLCPCLSVLGTGSDVGKSIVVAALCRIFSDRGIRVAPFKAQNMSNNSFVTPAGGEMGRAQVVQAEAARAPLTTDMNPVLLKPSTDITAQVVLHGHPLGNREAAAYFADTGALFRQAKRSLERLRAVYELVILEGAGSCAEVNLRRRDFVNFRMARAADAPVILVADIDRGGVFGQIVGTLAVLPPADRRRVKGFIINKFRGDAALFKDGMDWIEKHTQLPVLGLIPYFRHIEIDSEDGVPLDILIDPPPVPPDGRIRLAVLRLPHISNFTDFSPLARDGAVRLEYLARPRDLLSYHAVFLPGTKNVRADLDWMRREGWDVRLDEYAAHGGRIGGICGGYQMLGREIFDPAGVEGEPGWTDGLGLLPVATVLETKKVLARRRGVWHSLGETVEGYEIHMGITQRRPGAAPAVAFDVHRNDGTAETDGTVTPDGAVWGTYLHGLFDRPGFRRAYLRSLDAAYTPDRDGAGELAPEAFKDRQYDLLADHFRAHLDVEALYEIMASM